MQLRRSFVRAALAVALAFAGVTAPVAITAATADDAVAFDWATNPDGTLALVKQDGEWFASVVVTAADATVEGSSDTFAEGWEADGVADGSSADGATGIRLIGTWMLDGMPADVAAEQWQQCWMAELREWLLTRPPGATADSVGADDHAAMESFQTRCRGSMPPQLDPGNDAFGIPAHQGGDRFLVPVRALASGSVAVIRIAIEPLPQLDQSACDPWPSCWYQRYIDTVNAAGGAYWFPDLQCTTGCGASAGYRHIRYEPVSETVLSGVPPLPRLVDMPGAAEVGPFALPGAPRAEVAGVPLPSLNPVLILLTVGLALILAVLVALPTQLLDSTLSENAERIRGGLSRFGRFVARLVPSRRRAATAEGRPDRGSRDD